MVSGVQYNPYVQQYGQSYGSGHTQKADQNESVFTKVAKTDENDLTSEQIDTDFAQYLEDWDYFEELDAGVQAGDQNAIKEVLSIQAGEKADASDKAAVQYNKNTDYLIQIQNSAKALSQDTDAGLNADKSSNPFA